MQEPRITEGSKRDVENTALCLSKCFVNDPIINFLLNSKTEKEKLAYLPDYFRVLVKAASLNSAVIVELEDWAACAIWIPPGHTVDNWRTHIPAGFFSCLWDIGISGCWHMLVDFQSHVNSVKKRELAKYPRYYYMFFLGTLPERQGKGMGSRIVKHWQARATAEGIPIWTEATTARSHQLYLRLGFQDVQELRIGEGKADEDGSKKSAGEGVPLWTLIWHPPSAKSGTEAS